jgi:hypothetical protein
MYEMDICEKIRMNNNNIIMDYNRNKVLYDEYERQVMILSIKINNLLNKLEGRFFDMDLHQEHEVNADFVLLNQLKNENANIHFTNRYVIEFYENSKKRSKDLVWIV